MKHSVAYLSQDLESYAAKYTKKVISVALQFSLISNFAFFSTGGNALGQYDATYPENNDV